MFLIIQIFTPGLNRAYWGIWNILKKDNQRSVVHVGFVLSHNNLDSRHSRICVLKWNIRALENTFRITKGFNCNFIKSVKMHERLIKRETEEGYAVNDKGQCVRALSNCRKISGVMGRLASLDGTDTLLRFSL